MKMTPLWAEFCYLISGKVVVFVPSSALVGPPHLEESFVSERHVDESIACKQPPHIDESPVCQQPPHIDKSPVCEQPHIGKSVACEQPPIVEFSALAAEDAAPMMAVEFELEAEASSSEALPPAALPPALLLRCRCRLLPLLLVANAACRLLPLPPAACCRCRCCRYRCRLLLLPLLRRQGRLPLLPLSPAMLLLPLPSGTPCWRTVRGLARHARGPATQCRCAGRRFCAWQRFELCGDSGVSTYPGAACEGPRAAGRHRKSQRQPSHSHC